MPKGCSQQVACRITAGLSLSSLKHHTPLHMHSSALQVYLTAPGLASSRYPTQIPSWEVLAHTHWIDIVSKYAEGTHMHQWSYESCRLRKAILYYTYESKVGIFEYAWSIDIFEIRDSIWALECKRRSRGVTKGNIMGRSLRSCLRWHCWELNGAYASSQTEVLWQLEVFLWQIQEQ